MRSADPRLALLSLLLGASLTALCATPAPARAAGFYLLERGDRTLSRGGAFVAGIDDPSALWLNVAGLGFSGNQVVADATLTLLSVDYTRIDGGGHTLPTVTGRGAPLPIPTVAASFDLGLRHLTFGVGIFAPNAALLRYPATGVQGPAPQRYSLLDMDGSLISSVAAGVAWRPLRRLSLGAGVHVVMGSFGARVTLSACDGTICTFPEDPEYDTVAQMTLEPVFTAIATVGAIYDAGPFRLGFSVMSPFSLAGNASIAVRPPSAASFSGALVRSRAGTCAEVANEEVQADPHHRCRRTTADIELPFPWVVRFGAELRAVPRLLLEASVVLETWSVQQEIAVRPRDAWMVDTLGFLDYQIGPLDIPRHMHDTLSVRLGGQYAPTDTLLVRAGGYWEPGAFDDSYLSPVTLDSDKVVVAAGASLRVSRTLWVDALVGYALMSSRSVRHSRVPQPNPIRPPATTLDPSARSAGDPVFIANGDYSFSAPFFGLGIRWQPGSDAEHPRPPSAPRRPRPSPPPPAPPPPAPEPLPAEVAPAAEDVAAPPAGAPRRHRHAPRHRRRR